ncbi:MAG: hypothetical protein E7207_02670 [Clostridium butyricum]|nr:hypothetical protein [Clostridium butyricum]
MTLRECLEKYKIITIELIEKTKQGKELDDLLLQRDNIINEIFTLKFEKNEIKSTIDRLGIMLLEEEFQNNIKKEQLKIKNQIKSLRQNIVARKRYDDVQFRPSFFDKKI